MNFQVAEHLIKAIHEKKLANLTVISSEGGLRLQGLILYLKQI